MLDKHRPIPSSGPMENAVQTPHQQPLTIWTMTSGAAGMKSQVTGLANAIAARTAAKIQEKTVTLKSWASPFPGHLTPFPWQSIITEPSPLTPPWPDLLITSGRRTSSTSIAIGRISKGKTYRVHLQNPQTPSHYFDLVCPMAHDQLTGANIINTTTALHKVTNNDLCAAAKHWTPRWHPQLERPNRGPILGILLGGKNKKSGFDQKRLETLISLIKNARANQNAEIFITPSNRTETFVKDALHSEFENTPNIWLWNNEGENPYHAILALADHLLITSDSVSMISEALYTPKPVHIFPLTNIRRRHQLFLEILQQDNHIEWAHERINFSVKSTRPPIDETAKIAHIICEKINQHH